MSIPSSLSNKPTVSGRIGCGVHRRGTALDGWFWDLVGANAPTDQICYSGQHTRRGHWTSLGNYIRTGKGITIGNFLSQISDDQIERTPGELVCLYIAQASAGQLTIGRCSSKISDHDPA
jgi:hypothetical protein